MHTPAPGLENDTYKLLWDFNIQTDHLISARRPNLIIINKKKRICKIVDFAVPANHRINLKECAKKDKYLDLARELKKLWNMKVMIVLIVIGAFGTITKGLLKGLEELEVGGRVETIQTTALLRTARILRRVLETWGDSNSSEKPSANTDVKNSKGVKNNYNSNKPRWKIRPEGQLKKLRQKANVPEKEITKWYAGMRRQKQNYNKVWPRNLKSYIKKYWWKKENLKNSESGSYNTNKTRHFKITKENYTNKLAKNPWGQVDSKESKTE